VVARVLARVMAEHGIEWVRLPVEDLANVEWASSTQKNFYQEVVDYAQASTRTQFPAFL
jgi:hypothetical protein